MPTATFIHDGDNIDYRPTTDVAAGDVIVTGNLVGISKRDIPANTLGALAVTGVFEFPIEEAASMAMGETAYWNATDKWAQNDPDNGNAPKLGVAVSPPYPKDQVSKILIRLNH